MSEKNFWKFETEGLEFVINLQIEYNGTIKIPIGTNNWDVETYRNKLEKRKGNKQK